jgi:sugar lactone lactonase YvrE
MILSILISGLSLPALADDGSLTMLWESDGFSTPESVLYDADNGVLYVSNVNGAPGDKDGNGFISRVGLDGSMLEREWVTGLDAPKGLARVGNKLYVSDIDSLVVINIDGGAIVARHQAGGAGFFNDVAAAPNGDVYVSDTATNTIHRLRGGDLEVWLQDPELNGPNGLLVQGANLMVASIGPFGSPDKAQLFAVSLEDKSIRSATGGELVGKLDGLVRDPKGGYYVTDWPAGGLLHISDSGETRQLLDLEQGSADLGAIPERDLLLIPMMMNNKIVAWKVGGGG